MLGFLGHRPTLMPTRTSMSTYRDNGCSASRLRLDGANGTLHGYWQRRVLAHLHRQHSTRPAATVKLLASALLGAVNVLAESSGDGGGPGLPASCGSACLYPPGRCSQAAARPGDARYAAQRRYGHSAETGFGSGPIRARRIKSVERFKRQSTWSLLRNGDSVIDCRRARRGRHIGGRPAGRGRRRRRTHRGCGWTCFVRFCHISLLKMAVELRDNLCKRRAPAARHDPYAVHQCDVGLGTLDADRKALLNGSHSHVVGTTGRLANTDVGAVVPRARPIAPTIGMAH